MENIIKSGVSYISQQWQNRSPIFPLASWVCTSAAIQTLVKNIFPSMSGLPGKCLSWLSATVLIGLSYPYPRVNIALGPLSCLAALAYLNWPSRGGPLEICDHKIIEDTYCSRKHFVVQDSFECKRLVAEKSRFKSIKAKQGVWLKNAYTSSVHVFEGKCIWTNDKLMEFPAESIFARDGFELEGVNCLGSAICMKGIALAKKCNLFAIDAAEQIKLINSVCNKIFLSPSGEKCLISLEDAVVGDVYITPECKEIKIIGKGTIRGGIYFVGFEGKVIRSKTIALEGKIYQNVRLPFHLTKKS